MTDQHETTVTGSVHTGEQTVRTDAEETGDEHALLEHEPAPTDNELAEQVVEVAEHYVGFAARRFLDRQCHLHLNKSLADLRKEDLDDLAMWVDNTAPLIMDKDDGMSLAQEILDLKR